jgi:beta-glucosidase-like glycosyl hydrolase
VDIIEQKIIQGKIPVSRIDESYNRIIELKKKYGIIDTSNSSDKPNVPTEFALSQNYPNPFNPETTISYQLSVASNVTLKIYDVLGREVATLVDEYKQPGIYSSTFYTLRSSLSSGVYFYRLATPTISITKKMVLVK